MKKKNGFFSLLELLLVSGLLLIFFSLACVQLQKNERQQAVDLTARRLAMEIQYVRQLQVGNNRGKGAWTLKMEEDGYVFKRRGLAHEKKHEKKYVYPSSVRGEERTIRFDARGRPKEDMSISLFSRDGHYQRRIVLAMQTGRIRLE